MRSDRDLRNFAGMALMLTVVLGSPAVHAAPDRIEVVLDQAKVLQMPKGAQTVIIGNPVVADITVLKNHSMILTAKGYGVTNMIALDAQGTPVAESMIEVRAATDKVLVLQRGMDRESYSCVPNCMPFVSPGDATNFSTIAGSSIQSHNALAVPSAIGSSQK